MPAKAALFDSRANKIFDFGASPKNTVRYSQQGRLVLLAGFGNLAGYVEIWDRKHLRMLSRYQEPAAVYCEFLPDPTLLLAATLSPRLRVDNGFRLRTYTGEVVWEVPFKELYQVLQRPPASPSSAASAGVEAQPNKIVDEMSLTLTQGIMDKSGGSGVSALQSNGASAAAAAAKTTGAYVPPHLRNKSGGVPGSTGLPVKKQPSAAGVVNGSVGSLKAAGAAQSVSSSNSSVTTVSASVAKIAELEKKRVALSRKIRQIEQLKEKQAAGQHLETNQLDKLTTEPALREEMKTLEELLAKCKV